MMHLQFVVMALFYCFISWRAFGFEEHDVGSQLLSTESITEFVTFETGNNTENKKNSTNTEDPMPYNVKNHSSKTATDVGIALITIVIVLLIFFMAAYFIRKFEQLNRFTPSYRYSSLKTESNGSDIDDKVETQALVGASTEEEEYDEEECPSPPTLLVQSQTVMPTSVIINGSISSPLSNNTSTFSDAITETDEIIVVDSDDELLQ